MHDAIAPRSRSSLAIVRTLTECRPGHEPDGLPNTHSQWPSGTAFTTVDVLSGAENSGFAEGEYVVQIEHVSNLAQAVGLDELRANAAGQQIDRNGPKLQRQVRLHQAEVERLIDRRAEGSTIMELALEFGIHRTTVVAYLRRNGVES